MNLKTASLLLLLLPVGATVSGCTAVVVAGAAAGGYIAHEKGYRIRNPVTQNDEKKGN